MGKWKKEELEQALSEVTRRSAVDAEFRSLAVRDGAAAIARVNPKLSVTELEFRFVDNSGRVKTIPLPDLVEEIEENELSENDLEHVSGGTDAPPPPTTVTGG
jgi:nucleosome binding factor SPN SPT16 subunit